MVIVRGRCKDVGSGTHLQLPGLLQRGNVRHQQLQLVQNAAARLIMRTGRQEHITPALKDSQYNLKIVSNLSYG